METLLSVLHLVTAVFIVGPVAVLPMTALRALRAGDTGRTATSTRSLRLLSYLSLLVVVTGFGVMGLADPKYDLSITTPWIAASLLLYAVALLLTLTTVTPALAHAHQANVRAGYRRAAAGSGLATLCLLGAVVLMVWKP